MSKLRACQMQGALDIRQFGFMSLGIGHKSSLSVIEKFRLVSLFYYIFDIRYPSLLTVIVDFKKEEQCKTKNFFRTTSEPKNGVKSNSQLLYRRK